MIRVYFYVLLRALQILCFFKNYLFLHEYIFGPFKVIPTRYYTLVPTFLPILEALQKIIFCDLVQLRLRCRLYLFNHGPLQFREEESHRGPVLGNTMAAALLVYYFWPKIRCCFLVEIEQFWYEFRGDPCHDQIIGKNK